MASPRPLLLLTLLAWVVLADQGARKRVPVAFGANEGWARVVWAWPCQLTCPPPQSPAKAAALRASMRTGSVSATSSALTTRAAARTTWPSANPKVCLEGLGGPGVPYPAGHSPPPTLPAVTRGDVFTLPEDEYGAFDYPEGTSAGVLTQPESTTLSPGLQPQPEETPTQIQILSPEEEAPGPGQEASGPEGQAEVIPESPAEEELCSGKPFDAFTDLKNGSLFAFRGDSRGTSWGIGVCPWNLPSLTQPPAL